MPRRSFGQRQRLGLARIQAYRRREAIIRNTIRFRRRRFNRRSSLYRRARSAASRAIAMSYRYPRNYYRPPGLGRGAGHGYYMAKRRFLVAKRRYRRS